MNSVTNERLSKLIHACFGIDHYPLYLTRWPKKDIDNIILQFEIFLNELKEQKDILDIVLACTGPFKGPLSEPVADIKKIFHPKIITLIENPDMFGIYDNSVEKLNEDIYRFPLFQESFCDLLLDHSKQFIEFSSKNEDLFYFIKRRGIVFDWCGLNWLNDIVHNYVVKIP
eukprot:UN33462